MPTKQKLRSSRRNELSRNWGWLFGLGILFIIMGFIGLGMTVWLTFASVFLFGVFLLIAGVIQLVDVFKCHQWKGALYHGLIGLLYLIGGGLVIYDPVLASTMITAMIAWLLIAIGISRCIMAGALREGVGSVWLILAGIISIAIGILILVQWPLSALWVLGMFIAIELLVCGWTYIFIALSMRSLIL